MLPLPLLVSMYLYADPSSYMQILLLTILQTLFGSSATAAFERRIPGHRMRATLD